jgi:two-component system phosphate regulon response regulator PhoB/two-component system alkaline phosphatase synthesis response regulator PhoP
MNELVAVVDDETDITDLVSLHLKRSHFRVKEFYDGSSFISFLKEKVPELVILDLMLPDIDGIDICKKLRNDDQYSEVSIIMLTARAEETDRIIGLELGADDYVVKPFSPRELVARVKAVLRRKERKKDLKKIEIGGFLEIDLQKYIITLDGEKIDLTRTEFQILRYLASKPGWVFTRDEILDLLWGNEKYVLDRTVDVHIRHLRSKLGIHGGIIKNVRGIGYKLES